MANLHLKRVAGIIKTIKYRPRIAQQDAETLTRAVVAQLNRIVLDAAFAFQTLQLITVLNQAQL
jgi:hypothetical protein